MLPAALYIHLPWCIRKCPYCDFNSHKSPDVLPEKQYIAALVADLKNDLTYLPRRKITTIFLGGGTPSLFSAAAYEDLFNQLQQLLPFDSRIEITLEANPGTVEQQYFTGYRQSGINRLSLGIQSFDAEKLQALGRIHDDKQAKLAIDTARHAGFDNINIDIMHSLPNQTIDEGLADLEQAIAFKPEHISWYQLTLEPNTLFYKQPPSLPNEDDSYQLEQTGLALLQSAGYERYEISAFSQPQKAAKHNLNYWLFGDYYGIGAGAHGKITLDNTAEIVRTRKIRQPALYLNAKTSFLAAKEILTQDSIIFEFMLNTTRLQQPIANQLFSQKTGLPFTRLQPKLKEAEQKGFIITTKNHWQITALGRSYTNDVQALFLPD